MAEWIVGILAAIGAVLAALLKSSLGRERRLKEEAKDAEDRLQIVQSQMETVRKCREELGLIEKEAVENRPGKKAAPPDGDSDSRLERLNGLHKHTKDR